MLTWPPEFTVKKHPRARHVKLKATVRNGLELVVPPRFNHKEIPEILELNKAWIQKQLLKIQEESRKKEEVSLPTEIHFPLVKQCWRVSYIASNNKLKIHTRKHLNEIVLLGDIANRNTCETMLVTWIKKQARIHLLAALQEISVKTQLTYTKATIRDQSSRWGSCSSDKVINLNYKLLFLPAELATYILIHELCHTVHLNHSERFWRLVERFDPHWETHRRALRKSDEWIPLWIDRKIT